MDDGPTDCEPEKLNPLLQEFVTEYVMLVDGSQGYLEQMAFCVRDFEKFLGTKARLKDLQVDTIARYTASMRGRLSDQTRRSRRNMLVRLLRHANQDSVYRDVAPDFRPERIPRVKGAPRPASCWSLADVSRLVDFVRGVTGHRFQEPNCIGHGRKVNRPRPDLSYYWPAYFLAAWDSGMRGCDLRAIRWEDISEDGTFILQQRKTRKPLYGRFRELTMSYIHQLRVSAPGRTGPFELWCGLPQWRLMANLIVKKAGLKGSIGKLRHSAGTYAEIQNPGTGHLLLGNTPVVFESRYFDRSKQKIFHSPPPLKLSGVPCPDDSSLPFQGGQS